MSNAGFTGDLLLKPTTPTRWLITYNSVGQIGGYDERVTNSTTPDVVTQHRVSGITYDTWGQIATSADIEVDGKPGADSTTIVNGAMTTVTDQSNAVFDTLGRLVGYEEIIHRFGQSEDGDFLDDYEKHVRTATTYDADHPDRVLSTTEDVTNSDAPGMLTVVEQTNNSFGFNDQPTDYTETTHRTGIGFDTVDTVHRSGIVTDSQGRLLRYTEQHHLEHAAHRSSKRAMVGIVRRPQPVDRVSTINLHSREWRGDRRRFEEQNQHHLQRPKPNDRV